MAIVEQTPKFEGRKEGDLKMEHTQVRKEWEDEKYIELWVWGEIEKSLSQSFQPKKRFRASREWRCWKIDNVDRPVHIPILFGVKHLPSEHVRDFLRLKVWKFPRTGRGITGWVRRLALLIAKWGGCQLKSTRKFSEFFYFIFHFLASLGWLRHERRKRRAEGVALMPGIGRRAGVAAAMQHIRYTPLESTVEGPTRWAGWIDWIFVRGKLLYWLSVEFQWSFSFHTAVLGLVWK